MSLGAMMASASTFANAVNLVTASPWTVPAGVTRVVLRGAFTPGDAGPDIVPGGRGGGGGGSGAIVDCALTVAPGDLFTVTFPLPGQVQLNVTGSIAFVCRMEGGANASPSAVTGGNGGLAFWDGTNAGGGLGGATAGAAGGAGSTVAIAGGLIIGGGGGGAGSSTTGGAGGGTTFPGTPGSGVYGGGGGSLLQGQTRLSPSQVSTIGTGFLRALY
jgi:hypothetical protein